MGVLLWYDCPSTVAGVEEVGGAGAPGRCQVGGAGRGGGAGTVPGLLPAIGRTEGAVEARGRPCPTRRFIGTSIPPPRCRGLPLEYIPGV